MEGSYVGGVYNPPQANVEYNRRLALINTIKQNRSIDTDIELVIEEAKILEAFLLGTKA